MAYVNLASAIKLDRANAIVTDIGSNGQLLLYTGTVPASPDFAVTDTLLVTLPLSSTAGVASLGVQSALITAPGTLGTNGTYAMSFSGGGGTGAAGYFTVVSSTLVQAIITDPGAGYTSAPTIDGFDVAGLNGAAIVPVMTALVTFNPIGTATAVETGVAGYARITTSASTPIIDLDVGISNAFSVVMESTFVTDGGPVSCAASILIEA